MSDERPAEDTVPANPTPDPAVEAPPTEPAPVPDSPPPPEVADASADPVPSADPPPVVADTPPPPVEEPPAAPVPEPPPPEVVATGKVVEARDTVIIIRTGVAPGEHVYEVNEGHGAVPGHAITIYADGSVELGNHTPPEPPVITVPSQPPSE